MTTLRDFPGDDRFEIYVRNGLWEAQMTLPPGTDGARFCPELMQRLEAILGSGAVEAIPIERGQRASVAVS